MTDRVHVAERRIAELFAQLGLSGSMHAVELASEREVAVRAEQPVVWASVFKVVVVLALYRRADAGELDLSKRIELAGQGSSQTGLGAMRDGVRMSLRDLAYLAMAVSDNVAADAVFDAVGDEAVTAALSKVGLSMNNVGQRFRDLMASLQSDTGAADPAAIHAALEADPSLMGKLRATDPATSTSGTAREATALLRAIWEDSAASPHASAEVRRLMGLQVWPHRLASGFPGPEFKVAGKTGTVAGVRNEIGVVEHADGSRVAVAVFTQTDTPTASMPHLDRAIGTAARIAFDALSVRSAPPT